MKGYQIISLLLLAIFYAAYLIKMMIQRLHGIRTNQMGKGHKQKQTRVVEMLISIFSVAIIIVEAASMIMNTQALGTVGIMTGNILMTVGDIIFIAAMWTMKDSWRAGIPDGDKTKLVTAGIYQISRNPAFLGFDLVYIGIALAYSNIVLILVTLITIVVFHMQILEEEKFLVKRFGMDYQDYQKKVGRYFLFI